MAVLAGPGDSVDEIAADMAFSFIPGIGVYCDIRDAAVELSKLWPGGESPDWIGFGFAVAGIIAEVTPGDVAVDAAKSVYKAAKAGIINPSGIIFRSSLQKLKDLGSQLASGGDDVLEALESFGNTIQQIFPEFFGNPPILIGPDGLRFGDFLDDAIQNADEFRATQTWMSVVAGFPTQMQNIGAQYGTAVAKNIEQTINTLDDAAIQVLGNSGKLDIVAAGIAKAGWDPNSLAAYASAVRKLPTDSLLLKKFDDFSDIPGTNNLVYKLLAQDKGLEAVLDAAASLGKTNVSEFSARFTQGPDGKYIRSLTTQGGGDLDLISSGVAYEVKGGFSAFKSINDFYQQFSKDAEAAKDLGYGIGLAFPADILDKVMSKYGKKIKEIENKLDVQVIIQTF